MQGVLPQPLAYQQVRVFGNTISSLLEIWYNRHAIGVRKKNKRTKFPILSVYSFIQKHFVKGIIIGAVKG